MAFLYASNIQEGTGVLSFAVQMAADMQADLSILHNFDPRNVQGRYSPISDSQSVTAEPQSGGEILEKKQNEVETILKKEIAREISLLKKEPRVHYNFWQGPVEKMLIESSEKKDISLIIIGLHNEGETGASFLDALQIAGRMSCPVLAVPKGARYEAPAEMKFLSMSKEWETGVIEWLKKVFNGMNPAIQMVHLTKAKNFAAHLEYLRQQTAFPAIGPDATWNRNNTLENATAGNVLSSSWMILPQQKKGLLKKLFFPDFLEKIAKSSKLPFLFFHENMIKQTEQDDRQDGQG